MTASLPSSTAFATAASPVRASGSPPTFGDVGARLALGQPVLEPPAPATPTGWLGRLATRLEAKATLAREQRELAPWVSGMGAWGREPPVRAAVVAARLVLPDGRKLTPRTSRQSS